MRRVLVALGMLGGSFLVALAGSSPVGAGSPAAAGPGPGAGGWSIITSPNTGSTSDNLPLAASCVNAFDCWVVGLTSTNFQNGSFGPLLESWNGASWSIVKGPEPPAGHRYALLDATCLTGSDCWAVGGVLGAQNNPNSGLTLHWNGSAWLAVPSPLVNGTKGGYLTAVACASSADCWAAGALTGDSGSPSSALMEHWNGSAWSISRFAPSGQAHDTFNALTCDGPSDCWAVGAAGPNPENSNFLPIFPGAVGDQGLVEHWNGKAWSVVASPRAPAPEGGYLADVTCVRASNCWISGTTTNSSGTSGPSLMEHWNGATWVEVPSGTPAGEVGAILSSVTCLSASRCWAAGSTSASADNFQPEAFIEKWTGAKWVVQASPSVTALSLLRGLACVAGTGCWASGTTATGVGGNSPLFQTLIEQLKFPPGSVQGLYLMTSRGRVYRFGQARLHPPDSPRSDRTARVAMAVTPDGKGYWLVHADGAIFEFGDATFHGSPNVAALRRPIVGMATTPTGLGYWLVASNGKVFRFGDASAHGSLTASTFGTAVVGIEATPDGQGYWLVGADGKVFPFGDAKDYPAHRAGAGGQPGAQGQPDAGMAVTPDGRGYWLVTAGGDVRAFGDARYYGSPAAQGVTSSVPIASVVATPDGGGYWVVAADGSVYGYGDAAFLNSLAGRRPSAPITGAAGL